jgi:hypothetical protein
MDAKQAGENWSTETCRLGEAQHHREVYEIYRDYIKHEDNLINNRVGWFIQLHSFLIATYGILFAALMSSYFPQGTATIDPAIPQKVACAILAMVALVGIFSSLSAIMSIDAADRAITKLSKTWDGVSEGWAADRRILPPLIGGGDTKNDRLGARFHLWLPRVMLAVWIVSMCVPTQLWRLSPEAAPMIQVVQNGSGSGAAPLK